MTHITVKLPRMLVRRLITEAGFNHQNRKFCGRESKCRDDCCRERINHCFWCKHQQQTGAAGTSSCLETDRSPRERSRSPPRPGKSGVHERVASRQGGVLAGTFMAGTFWRLAMGRSGRPATRPGLQLADSRAVLGI